MRKSEKMKENADFAEDNGTQARGEQNNSDTKGVPFKYSVRIILLTTRQGRPSSQPTPCKSTALVYASMHVLPPLLLS